jgi:hypothetical protein
VESCLAPGFERAGSAIAVLEKLDVGHLSPLKARQQTKRRCDFLPDHVRFLGKGAEEGNAATLLNSIGDLENRVFSSSVGLPQRHQTEPVALCECRPTAQFS